MKRMYKKNTEQIRQKQKLYISQWNIDEHKKDYQALKDTYSTYFFANPTVKKHLRHFSKAASKEPKTVDLKRLTFLVDEKYRNRNISLLNQSQKSPKQLSPRVNQHNQVLNSYRNSLRPQSLNRLVHLNKQGSSKMNKDEQSRAQMHNKLPQIIQHKKVYKSRNKNPENLQSGGHANLLRLVQNEKRSNKIVGVQKQQIIESDDVIVNKNSDSVLVNNEESNAQCSEQQHNKLDHSRNSAKDQGKCQF